MYDVKTSTIIEMFYKVGDKSLRHLLLLSFLGNKER